MKPAKGKIHKSIVITYVGQEARLEINDEVDVRSDEEDSIREEHIIWLERDNETNASVQQNYRNDSNNTVMWWGWKRSEKNARCEHTREKKKT